MSGMPEMLISFPGNKRVNAAFNGWEIKTDQGPYAGGDGTAPDPFTLFLASLGTCAGIFVKGFCDSRGLDATGIDLRMRPTRDATGRLADVEIDINVPTDFPEKYREALVRSADGCLVKRTMLNPPEFKIKTVVKDA